MGAKEIQFAFKSGVLIVRTLDLVRLADLVELKRLESSAALQLLMTKHGWLKVDGNLSIHTVES